MEKERRPVSAMDRERTMQNLVDMQRKYEEKHQRDKERQLLRVRHVKTQSLKVSPEANVLTQFVFLGSGASVDSSEQKS